VRSRFRVRARARKSLETRPAWRQPQQELRVSKIQGAQGMNHFKFVRGVACTLLTAASVIGCSSQDEHEAPAAAESAILNVDQFLYFTCNATGWNVSDANRLKSTSDPAVFTLDYQVPQPWMVSSPDHCAFVMTNELNGWGTAQTRYSDSHPTTPVDVPGGDRLVVSTTNFPVRYPAIGAYRLSVDWTQKTFTISNNVTAEQRLEACARDPRVVAGLVSAEICAGADIFFRETFGGNGRTCGSCHPQDNNTTIDVPFITALRARNPRDPLFIADNDPNLTNLETTDLVNFAAILENVDGFGTDPTQRFVSRTVSHVLSLKTSISPDPGDETANPPLERTGWGGDGVEDGSLLGFLEGAIKQHFTKNLQRRPNVDFRPPTPLEAELTREFQLNLGRLNELNLQTVSILDAEAEDGRLAFMDNNRGRCNVCHVNAGANFQDTGLNRNFENGVEFAGSANHLHRGTVGGIVLSDGGFGGVDLEQPNFPSGGGEVMNAFGDGTFSPPPLIEAADTAPFFHNAFRFQTRFPDDIEEAVNFYRLPNDAFGRSQGGRFLEARFGTRLALDGVDSAHIARFLRVLNGAFNLDIARQRLDAAWLLADRFGDSGSEIQRRLMELAVVEVDDALEVLPQDGDIYPGVRALLLEAKDDVAEGLSAFSARKTHITSALAQIATGRGRFGTNITFQLGQGNLMF
jgi:hypothetical protein